MRNMEYTDILYETRGAAVWITINRPDKYNAFRGVTCEELIHAITRAGWDKSVAAIVLTGAGEKAFCTGGDQSAHDGGYDGRCTIGLPVEELQSSIRDVPKPVIARVNGFAIGGGNVLVTCCALAIAGERAVFGQVGPRGGSVDPGFGTAPSGSRRGREEGPRNVVLLPPIHLRTSSADGVDQCGRGRGRPRCRG